MKQSRFYLISLVAAFCVLAAACGSSSEISTSSASETRSEIDGAVDLAARINEQDMSQARATLDGAQAKWEGLEPFAYTMSVGFESINMLEIDFDEDGNLVSERVLLGDPGGDGWGPFPRSVGEAFELVEESVTSFETGELEVPPAGQCGNHFNAQFDANLGSPTYFDTLGPCDDGVGLRIEITPDVPIEALSDGPIEDQGECDRDEFSAVWRSPRAAGTEPLAANDGEYDEGGVGVVELILNDDEVELLSGDTIELFDSWFCTASTIIGVTSAGEEWELATINDDGTLTARNETLSKSDGG